MPSHDTDPNGRDPAGSSRSPRGRAGGQRSSAQAFPAPSFLDLLAALRRRWFSAVFLGLFAGGLVAGAVWLLLPQARQTASAKLHMPKLPEHLLFDHPEAEFDFVSFQQTQV